MQYKIVSRVIDKKKRESPPGDPMAKKQTSKEVQDKKLLDKVHAIMKRFERKKTRI